MKNKVFLTFIFALLLFASEAQNIRHDQLQAPEQETSDSLIFYMHDSEGYWRLGKGVLDTSMVQYIEAYATIEQLNDSVAVLRGDIPTLLTEMDSAGFKVDYSQLTNVPAFLISETDPIYAGDSAYIKSHISGIATNQQAIIDTASSIRADIPTLLTDLDSTGFSIDTTQVRNLKTFVENNSGEVSGTENYIPKFGESGLTESNIYQTPSGQVTLNKTTTYGDASFVSKAKNQLSPSFIAESYSGTNGWARLDFLNAGTGGLGLIYLDAVNNLTFRNNVSNGIINFLIGSTELMRITPTGNVGIGATHPTAKLEVNGNIKADTIKAVLDTIYADKTRWSEFVGGGDAIGDITSVVAGDGLDLGGDFGDVTLKLGTPSSILSSSTNSVSNTSHTHALGDNAVTYSKLNNNIISGQTAITSGLVSTDELLLSDAGVLKRMDVSVLESYMQNNLDFGDLDLSSLTVNNTLLSSLDHLVYVNSADNTSYRISPSYLGTYLSNYIQLENLSDVPSPTANYFLQRNSTNTGYNWVAGTGSTGTDIDVVQQDYNVEIKSSTGSNDIIYSATSTEAGVMSKYDKVHLDAAYGWGDHSTEGYLTDAPSNGSLYGRKNGAWTVISTGTSAVTSVVAGSLIDVSSTTGDVTVNVDLSEATSDNTFSSTDELIYLTGSTQKRGTVSGLESYMQSNLDFASSGTFDDIYLDNTTFTNQQGIIYKGGERFIHNFNYGNNGTVTTKGQNTFVGLYSGNFTMGSTATLTYESSENTAVGYGNLISNTKGYGNVAIGSQSMYANTTGSLNTSVGLSSMLNNISGIRNTAIGEGSLSDNTTGYFNTSIGALSLLSNTTGNNNTALGGSSLQGITTGNNNTALGGSSGTSTSVSGVLNTEGSNSVFIGSGTKSLGQTGINEIVIGYNAIGKGSNTAVIGNDDLNALYSSGQLVPATKASAPNTPVEGGIYYNTSDNHFYGYNGTTWKQLDN